MRRHDRNLWEYILFGFYLKRSKLVDAFHKYYYYLLVHYIAHKTGIIEYVICYHPCSSLG